MSYMPHQEFSLLLPWILGIRDYVIGIIGIAVIFIIHGIFLVRIVSIFEIKQEVHIENKHLKRILPGFYLTFLELVMLHFVEIIIWALILGGLQIIPTPSDALLFSGSTYTTLGFSGNILPPTWKSLAFFIAFSGLFTLAWTGSALVGMMTTYKKIWKLVHQNEIERYKTQLLKKEK